MSWAQVLVDISSKRNNQLNIKKNEIIKVEKYNENWFISTLNNVTGYVLAKHIKLLDTYEENKPLLLNYPPLLFQETTTMPQVESNTSWIYVFTASIIFLVIALFTFLNWMINKRKNRRKNKNKIYKDYQQSPGKLRVKPLLSDKSIFSYFLYFFFISGMNLKMRNVFYIIDQIL
jgi:hypothetical protein